MSYCDACRLKIGKFLCSKCKKANYCSKECQVEGWKVHKQLCKPEILLNRKEVMLVKIAFYQQKY